jgi:hypothetical protein
MISCHFAENIMSILVRDPEIDRQVRALAKRLDCSLQDAVGHALKIELEHAKNRRSAMEAATREARNKLNAGGMFKDDGLSHNAFWDQEYGDT